jgi:outer membrane protein TolC
MNRFDSAESAVPRRVLSVRARGRSGRAAAVTAMTAAAVVLPLAGCRSPLGGGDAGVEPVARVMQAAIDREIREAADRGETRVTDYRASQVEQTLAERRDRLEELTPANGGTGSSISTDSLGTDLLGGAQQVIELDLDTAVLRAVTANLGIEQARLQPAIDAEDVIDAEAVFDWVFFADASVVETDRPAVVRTIGGTPISPGVSASRSYRFATGLDRRFDFGGALRVQLDADRDDSRTPGVSNAPDPSYPSGVTLTFEQPLLRNFGRDVNRATIRLARNARARSAADLERTMLDVTRQVEDAYHDLVLAWRQLEVQQWLVGVGIEVRDVLDQRRAFDARDAQFADAVARVEQRQADVLRALRAVQAASDRLKLLLNDPELTIGSEAMIRPSGELDASPFTFSLRDLVVNAIDRRPEVRQSLLFVDDASIARQIAEDGVLPRLDLTAQVAWRSLGDSYDESLGDLFDDEFIEYLLGLRFEMPIGNRGPESQVRRARLVRSQSLARYREVVQLVVQDVKAALRDVETGYDLIQATRSFRVAQAENLRALLVEKQTLAGLTPEFLNLEFQRQETLATARIQEFDARVRYRQAIAALARATASSLDGYGIEVDGSDTEPGTGPMTTGTTGPTGRGG